MFYIITDLNGKCKHFFPKLFQIINCVFSQNPLYKSKKYCYNIQQQTKEVMSMKVLFQNVPVDIDELIFAGETTVPSDR